MHWSPDGRQLVLMGRQPGKPWKIYTMDTDGGHFQEVLDESRSEADADWSPDSRTLVFGRLPDLMAEASQPKAIYTVDLATKAMTKLPGSDGLFSPRWSADGKYIAALSIDQKKLMLFDVAAHRPGACSPDGNIADPVWSHDDSAIYFHDFVQADQPIYKVASRPAKSNASPTCTTYAPPTSSTTASPASLPATFPSSAPGCRRQYLRRRTSPLILPGNRLRPCPCTHPFGEGLFTGKAVPAAPSGMSTRAAISEIKNPGRPWKTTSPRFRNRSLLAAAE